MPSRIHYAYPKLGGGLTRLLDLQADALALSDGDPVETWADASGLGHDFTQSGSARPTYHTGGGTLYVQFDGVDDWLLGGDFADNLASFTVFAVVKTYTDDQSGASLIARISNDESGDWWMFQCNRAVTTNGAGLLIRGDGATHSRYVTNTGVGANGMYIAAGELTSSTILHCRINGDSSGEVVVDNDIITSFSNALTVSIAAEGDGSLSGYMKTDVCAVMIYAPAPNASDRQAIEGWLADKYGIAL